VVLLFVGFCFYYLAVFGFRGFDAPLFIELSRLKNKCNCTAIYMKTQCSQTNEMQHYLGKESVLGAGEGEERVVILKSLI
jgi:hypothetical protein